jgi:hypothetical protein
VALCILVVSWAIALQKKTKKKKNTCLHYIVEKIIQYIYVMLQGVKFKHGITFGAVAIIYP